MAHQRKLIRTAVEDRLKASGIVPAERVFSNRSRELKRNELPAILIYALEEAVEQSCEAPREYKRTLTIAVEMVAQAAEESDLDDTLDDMAEMVEAEIFKDETFGGVASDTLLGASSFEVLEGGEKPVGRLGVTLSMPYFQQLPGDMTAELDDFNKMSTVVQEPNTGANISGTDTVPQ